MLLSKLVVETLRKAPSDIKILSHSLMLRAGFIKQVAVGVYSLTMPAQKIALKIENIIRDEMNKLYGQEVKFPVVMPRELWEETDRYNSIGQEMVRFKDRNSHDMLLGMTHEEAAVHLARNIVSSYNQLPCMIYQIQTKFRDEARSRGGLIRVREFTMKDAYSFHNSQEDLESYYDTVYNGYNNIFRRIGLKNFISVKSDTGMMGGSVAHEFMLLADCGEDEIVICPVCGYKSNMEVAECVNHIDKSNNTMELSEVYTGEAHDIASVSALLKVSENQTLKAVVFKIKDEDIVVICFIRGDLEINEAKLKKVIKKNIIPIDNAADYGIKVGNIGPLYLNIDKSIIIYDKSIEGANNLVCGANKESYHLTGLNVTRDIPDAQFYDISKVLAGAECIKCGNKLTIKNGIEIGNIFQLGIKYTKSMNMTALNSKGESFNPIMGCYGIGVGRAIASIIEESNDDKGIILPITVAPFAAHICPIRLDDENVNSLTYKIYKDLIAAGIDTLLDDRNLSPGVKFADADLMGMPIRVVVSPKNIEKGEVELSTRHNGEKIMVSIDNAVQAIKDIITQLEENYR